MRRRRMTRRACSDPLPYQRGELPLPRNDEADSDGYTEEFETGLYLCRWPGGGFSIVVAGNRLDAVVRLDEWRAAEPRWLIPLDGAMIDFRLNDNGEICLAQFGDATATAIWQYRYPALDEVLTEFGGPSSRNAKAKIHEAVAHERTSLFG